jgi:hypothetical protein
MSLREIWNSTFNILSYMLHQENVQLTCRRIFFFLKTQGSRHGATVRSEKMKRTQNVSTA